MKYFLFLLLIFSAGTAQAEECPQINRAVEETYASYELQRTGLSIGHRQAVQELNRQALSVQDLLMEVRQMTAICDQAIVLQVVENFSAALSRRTPRDLHDLCARQWLTRMQALFPTPGTPEKSGTPPGGGTSSGNCIIFKTPKGEEKKHCFDMIADWDWRMRLIQIGLIEKIDPKGPVILKPDAWERLEGMDQTLSKNALQKPTGAFEQRWNSTLTKTLKMSRP